MAEGFRSELEELQEELERVRRRRRDPACVPAEPRADGGRPATVVTQPVAGEWSCRGKSDEGF